MLRPNLLAAQCAGQRADNVATPAALQRLRLRTGRTAARAESGTRSQQAALEPKSLMPRARTDGGRTKPERSFGRLKKDSDAGRTGATRSEPPGGHRSTRHPGCQRRGQGAAERAGCITCAAGPSRAARPKLRAEQGRRQAPPRQHHRWIKPASGERRDAAKPAATSPLSAAQSERKQVEESAAMWLERIIKIRT